MSEDTSIISERKRLAQLIAKETNHKEREKLMDLDLKLRDKLAANYAANDPVQAHMRQTAQQRMREIEMKASMGREAFSARYGR